MEKLPTVKLDEVVHRGTSVVTVTYAINAAITQAIGQVTGGKWSQTHKCWYYGKRDGLLRSLRVALKGKALLDETALKQPTGPKPASMDPDIPREQGDLPEIDHFVQYLKSRRYSERTIYTYKEALVVFFRFFDGKPVETIDNDDLIRFNNQYILARKLSSSFQNQVVNAVKLFYRIAENRHLDPLLIHRPKREKILPSVLSKEEVKMILAAPTNLKHRAMLALVYSCGLRCGELLRLRIEHVESKRGLLIIKQSKGKKDRVVPIGSKIITLLRDYYRSFKPGVYLFEGQEAGTMYDERSLQNVLKQSVAKARISKPVTLHWLRHSYATHLLENGVDLRYIQTLLGHQSSRTTEIYTHVSTNNLQNIVSPFDTL